MVVLAGSGCSFDEAERNLKELCHLQLSNDVVRRVWEHKNNVAEGFTKKYGIHTLVYFELHETMPDAIIREKQMKRWNRAWKIEKIQESNPEWRDLYKDILN